MDRKNKADKPGSYRARQARLDEIDGRRLPPVQQYWINRMIHAREENGDIGPVRDMLNFSGYPPATIDAAERWALSHPALEPRILHLKNHLNAETCSQLIEDGDANAAIAGEVTHEEGLKLLSTRSEVREMQILPWRHCLKDVIVLIQKICSRQVVPYFEDTISQFEYPGLFKYQAGGRYDLHVDADAKEPGSDRWYRQRRREYSLVIYLNDEFTGGELVFDNFGVRIKPGLGDVVCFPSDFRYIHAAKPVLEGVRYCIVTWLQASKSQKTDYGNNEITPLFIVPENR